MIRRIGRIALPPVAPGQSSSHHRCCCICSVARDGSDATALPYIKVMIGNSMQYYNDLPRFLEAISDGHIEQNSCLHGDSNLHSILVTGSGTFQLWRSEARESPLTTRTQDMTLALARFNSSLLL
jgi:hypothetical protein